MNESWQRIVREALDRGLESSKGAIPGAKLRQIIARIAPSYSEEYPPAGYEGEKFRDFLGRFGSLLTVLPRKGQDILVAPSDRPELLAAEEAGRAQLREDIFEAFTRIPRESPPREPWYERSTDKVLWNTADEAVNHPEFVRIPPATLAQELEERRVFALASEIDPAVRDKLLANLQEHSALWAFSRIVKESGLAQKWHFFRFKAILGRIRNWCGSEHVDWREDWLVSRDDQATRPVQFDLSEFLRKQQRFGAFLEELTDEDLKRISVPLDIVLKHLGK